MSDPPRYTYQVGDHVLVRSASFVGPEEPPYEAVVVECRDQWIKVRYINDGHVDTVHNQRVLFDPQKGWK